MVLQTSSEIRREEIYAVAARLFYSAGFHATSMRTIAAQVSIQMPTLYYYFPSKEALLANIMSSVLLRLIRGLERRLSAMDGPREQLYEAVRFHVCFHCEFPEEATIVDTEMRALSDESRTTIKSLRDEYEQMFKNILHEGKASGVFRVADVNIASYALLSMATGVIGWYRQTGRYSAEQIAEMYATLAIRGVSNGEGAWGSIAGRT
ncbi:MAG: TetR family transcriptional regulator [Thermaerobacter sp.]|nr:TetR family transcriptional regulator [Thermaerobacter sp.]